MSERKTILPPPGTRSLEDEIYRLTGHHETMRRWCVRAVHARPFLELIQGRGLVERVPMSSCQAGDNPASEVRLIRVSFTPQSDGKKRSSP